MHLSPSFLRWPTGHGCVHGKSFSYVTDINGSPLLVMRKWGNEQRTLQQFDCAVMSRILFFFLPLWPQGPRQAAHHVSTKVWPVTALLNAALCTLSTRQEHPFYCCNKRAHWDHVGPEVNTIHPTVTFLSDNGAFFWSYQTHDTRFDCAKMPLLWHLELSRYLLIPETNVKHTFL